MNLVLRQITCILSAAAIININPAQAAEGAKSCIITDQGFRVCGKAESSRNNASTRKDAQVGSIVMTLDRCVRYQGNGNKLLACVFALSNKDREETTGFLWVSGSSVLDSQGVVYRGIQGELGSYSGGNIPLTLVPGANYKGAIGFGNIADDVDRLQVVTIQFRNRDFIFRDIPIADR